MKRSFAVMTFLIVAAGPALGHGNLTSSDPAAGSRVAEPPSVVELELAEPPTRESRFLVFDGCDAMLINNITGDGPNMRLSLDPGQPGRWRVEYRVVSAQDGHLVRGNFAFRVAGQRDCGEEDASPEPEATDASDEAAGVGFEDEEGQTGPLIPILAIGAGIVVLALVIRKLMTR